MFEIQLITDTTVYCHYNGEDLDIPKSAILNWADLHDRRDYCSDEMVGPNHVQMAGTISEEEYFTYENMEKEVPEFLKTRTVSGKLRNMPNLATSFRKLTDKKAI